MKLVLFCMPTVPAASQNKRAALRPIGRNAERYHAMIEELRTLAIVGDELGVHAISTTEHHFHTEGFEANPNPLMLFSDIAARTKRINVAPMSVVVTPENPIRVAENIAMLDVMSKGRLKVGFARGYQKRWLQIIGQTVGVTPAQVTTKEDDENNRRIFEEFEEIILKALSNDVFDYKGKYFSVPYPYEDGIDGWAAVDFTRTYGADGELDENGIVRKIGTVPGPWQKPYPDIWRTTTSPSTVIEAARKGYVPFLVTPQASQVRESCRVYQEEAAKVGYDLKLGQKVGVTRAITIGKTPEEAWNMAVRTTGEVWHNYFNLFGFAEPLRYENEDRQNFPYPRQFPTVEECTQRLADTGMSLQGTPDTIKRELEQLHRCYEKDGELEYLCWMFNSQGMIPIEEQVDQVTEFVEKIWKPMFG